MPPLAAILRHTWLSLRLNFRSPAAIVYGYGVPVFFLIAFAALFRERRPPLIGELGQVLTVCVLGGCCFGMPTAIVAERERGVWRRYQMLPVPPMAIIASTMAARFVLVAGAATLQVGLALTIYHMPLPTHACQLAAALSLSIFAFLGVGLVIAMAADTVPAVQALGQVVFLPMIIIGGVGVPLGALPAWARHVAAFLPGQYAVQALQNCADGDGLHPAGFAITALLVTGVAGCAAGLGLIRFDAGPRQRGGPAWIALALAAWLAVGLAAEAMGRASPMKSNVIGVAHAADPSADITQQQIDSISYADLADDAGLVSPFATSLDELTTDEKQRVLAVMAKLDTWPPARDPAIGQRVRNVLSAAAIADVLQDDREAGLPPALLNWLKARIAPMPLRQALAWIALDPAAGQSFFRVPELGMEGDADPRQVRERSAIYARKMLGRLTGQLPLESAIPRPATAR